MSFGEVQIENIVVLILVLDIVEERISLKSGIFKRVCSSNLTLC